MDLSTLQSRASSTPYIPLHRTQIHPRINSLSHLQSRSTANSSISRERCLPFLAFLVILSFLLYLFSVARGVHHSAKFNAPRSKGYGIIIDAANSGSRVHVFEFLSEGRVPFVSFDGKGSDSLKSKPGLWAFSSNPEKAGSSLMELLEYAKKRIPAKEWGSSKLQLIVSTGLHGVSTDARKIILESCRSVLSLSGFLFTDEWASVITGREEGIYAWVAANYALGTLGEDPKKTTGIVELGGASTQVIFVPREPPPLEFSLTLKLAGVTYNLYTQSLLHFGQDAAWESLHQLHSSSAIEPWIHSTEEFQIDPCTPRGYPHNLSLIQISRNSPEAVNQASLALKSAGNFSACRSKASQLLRKVSDKCLNLPCKLGAIIPELQNKSFSEQNFFYTSKFFGLVPRASLSDLELAGHHFCEGDWNKLKDEHSGVDDDDLSMYCFSSAYIVALLHDGLGISFDDKRVGFANQAGGIPLDWTLGAFLLQTVMDPEPEPRPSDWTIGKDSLTFFVLFVILFLIIIFTFYVSQWRKPQVKTIYDLEKGRYIITKIAR